MQNTASHRSTLLHRAVAEGAPLTFGGRVTARARNRISTGSSGLVACYPSGAGHASAGIDSLSSGILAGCQRLKTTWPAIVAIQVFIVSVVCAYFYVPQTAFLFDWLIAMRNRLGPLFGVFGMGLIVGGLSEVLKVYMQQKGRWERQNFKNLAFNISFFGAWGCLSYYKFNFYSWLLGTGGSPQVLLPKLFLDLVVYSALFYNPVCGMILNWRSLDYDWSRLRAEITPFKGYACRILVPTQFFHWVLWLPLTSVVFLLPTALQLPVVILGVTLWVILLSALSAKPSR